MELPFQGLINYEIELNSQGTKIYDQLARQS